MEDIKYAGFWCRSCALSLDFLVFSPIHILTIWVMMQHTSNYVALSVIGFLLFFTYQAYFYKRWGATLGKMALRVRVVDLQGAALENKHVLLRLAVAFILGALITLGNASLFASIDTAAFTALSFQDQSNFVQENETPFLAYTMLVMQLWVVCSALTLLLNKKKRAIHDFIASTVVVHNVK